MSFEEMVDAFEEALEHCMLCKEHNADPDTRPNEVIPEEDIHECHQVEAAAKQALLDEYARVNRELLHEILAKDEVIKQRDELRAAIREQSHSNQSLCFWADYMRAADTCTTGNCIWVRCQ